MNVWFIAPIRDSVRLIVWRWETHTLFTSSKCNLISQWDFVYARTINSILHPGTCLPLFTIVQHSIQSAQLNLLDTRFHWWACFAIIMLKIRRRIGIRNKTHKVYLLILCDANQMLKQSAYFVTYILKIRRRIGIRNKTQVILINTLRRKSIVKTISLFCHIYP